MRSEQERWERVCAAVKERGARIRRRRQVAAGVAGLVILLLLVVVPFGLKREEMIPDRLAFIGEAEMEVVLLEHDIVMDEMGLY